jgi:hypothetical protein
MAMATFVFIQFCCYLLAIGVSYVSTDGGEDCAIQNDDYCHCKTASGFALSLNSNKFP